MSNGITIIPGGRVRPTVLSGGQVLRTNLSGGAGGPSSTGATPPDFGGLYLNLCPADLLGTIALDDPITDLPAQGGLITGNFSASSTARPILQDDGTGRIGAYHDGIDDMLTIAGLSLDLTAGFTLLLVANRTAATVGPGFFRADAGSDGATGSLAEHYWGYTDGGYGITRAPQVVIPGGTNNGWWPDTLTAVGMISSGGLLRDGSMSSGTLGAPSSVITRIQLAGYDRRKALGYLYQLLLYPFELSAPQRETVRDYLRTRWNSGSPF